MREIIGVKSKHKIIGPRHEEKKHETLVSAEEMLRAKDRAHFITTELQNLSLIILRHQP